MDIPSVIQYFSLFGAIIAVILGILKILEYLTDKPKLHIQQRSCMYTNRQDSEGNDRTEFEGSIEITNVGKRTILIKEILVDILGRKKERLNIYSRLFEVNKVLGLNDYSKTPISYTVEKKIPKQKYYFKLTIRTNYKQYKKIVLVYSIEECEDDYYSELDEGLKKGKFE